VSGRCGFHWVLGVDRAMQCDGIPAAVLVVSRWRVGARRVGVCDRHLGPAVAALEPEADGALEVMVTDHGRRLFAGAGAACFPDLAAGERAVAEPA